jgi:uncharacterized membrane protein YphA (DoxX/SURF4 family)
MSTALLIARLALAAVFAIAGLSKLVSRRPLRTSLSAFGLPRQLVTPVSVALPLAELVVAGLLVPASTAQAAAWVALGLLVVFSAVIARALSRHERPDCNCFGRAYSAPIGPETLVRNGCLSALAATVAIAGPGESLAGADPSAEAVFGAAVVAAIALLAWFGWQLFRQNGRLIERVRVLEAAAARQVPDGQPPLPAEDEHELPPLSVTQVEHGRRHREGALVRPETIA